MKVNADSMKSFRDLIDSCMDRNIILQIERKGFEKRPIMGIVHSKFSHEIYPTCKIEVDGITEEIFLDEVRGVEII